MHVWRPSRAERIRSVNGRTHRVRGARTREPVHLHSRQKRLSAAPDSGSSCVPLYDSQLDRRAIQRGYEPDRGSASTSCQHHAPSLGFEGPTTLRSAAVISAESKRLHLVMTSNALAGQCERLALRSCPKAPEGIWPFFERSRPTSLASIGVCGEAEIGGRQRCTGRVPMADPGEAVTITACRSGQRSCGGLSLLSSLLSARSRDDQRSAAGNTIRRFPCSGSENETTGHQWISLGETHDIFEGTEQIQQLVISRAISGLRIE